MDERNNYLSSKVLEIFFLFLGLSPVVPILLLEHQQRLAFSRPDSSFRADVLNK